MTSPPPALVLSPHLDDAVLSASAALSTGAHVVTVFAGIPPEDAPRGDWDILTRAASAAGRVRERRAEDQAALALFPVSCEHWEFLDGQHRGEPADAAAIVTRLRSLLGARPELWAPAGIGHPDHAAVSDAAVAAAAEAGLDRVMLYADVPHAVPYGWPEAVSGEPDPPHLDRGAWLDAQL
ncbi:MAG: PIG-L family deacetylase, partial [Candidatus Dormibacteraeota bacterium]|nr:PIG-L family deacetylase [Candidatus Dormibacteraeota bacterium]